MPTPAKSTTNVLIALACAVITAIAPLQPALAATDANAKVYDARLMRLAEILGAVHYLRELCDGSDGQRWRDAVAALVKSEGSTALRRANIAQRFNLGYRGYRRTYRKCTPSAKSTIARFFKEAVEISEALVKLAD